MPRKKDVEMNRRQIRGIAMAHQAARLSAGMPLANRARESYAKVVRATSGMTYQERTTPPVLRVHERFVLLGLLAFVATLLVSCLRVLP
jgi:hypothetical protein